MELGRHMLVLRRRATVEGAYPDYVGVRATTTNETDLQRLKCP